MGQNSFCSFGQNSGAFGNFKDGSNEGHVFGQNEGNFSNDFGTGNYGGVNGAGWGNYGSDTTFCDHHLLADMSPIQRHKFLKANPDIAQRLKVSKYYRVCLLFMYGNH